MSKHSCFHAALGLLSVNIAMAAYVDLATPGNSANLTFSVVDSTLTWSVPSGSLTLPDAGFASASLERTDWTLQLMLGLHDKESAASLAAGPVGPTFAYQQLSLAFFRFSGAEQLFAANTLIITVGNLYSTEAAPITGFVFTGPDAAARESAWDVTYSAVDGTLVFTNTSAFTVSSDESLWLHGQFTASPIPEPSSAAVLTGLAAAAGAWVRRRRQG